MRVVAIALVALGLQAIPPQVTQVQEWFEAGRYQQIVDVASQAPDPQAQYLVASSFDRLGQFDEARRVYSELSARGDGDPWAWIGRSASSLVTNGDAPTPQAVETAFVAAQQAVAAVTPASATADAAAPLGSGSAIAHYQMGLAQSFRNDYSGAAAAFEQATSHDSGFAYAYYYAGLANSRVDRADRMMINFERFLQLAPEAPEAARVRSLMRGVRGR